MGSPLSGRKVEIEPGSEAARTVIAWMGDEVRLIGMARLVGVHKDSLRRYLRGDRAPPFPVMLALRERTGARLEDWARPPEETDVEQNENGVPRAHA